MHTQWYVRVMMLALLGHTRVIVKSDNEPAMIALKTAIKAEAGQSVELEGRSSHPTSDQIIPEESPTYDSASNGKVEVTIRHLQARFRTIRCALEARLGQTIHEDHPSLPWLVRHASWVKNRCMVQKGGRTSYERWKDKTCSGQLVEFGEHVLYLRPGTRGKDKLLSRWESGIWLGMRDESGEVIIGTEMGCLKVRDVRRIWKCR